MPIKHIRFLSREPISQPDNFLEMRRLITGEDSNGDISITWVDIKGDHKKLYTMRSMRIYYVATGTLEFEDENGERVLAEENDLVVIPKGTPYRFCGEATYLVINVPAYREGDDVYL
jgi:mannose-6-phosphate isomerase-like protein (cupin superfamily)